MDESQGGSGQPSAAEGSPASGTALFPPDNSPHPDSGGGGGGDDYAIDMPPSATATGSASRGRSQSAAVHRNHHQENDEEEDRDLLLAIALSLQEQERANLSKAHGEEAREDGEAAGSSSRGDETAAMKGTGQREGPRPDKAASGSLKGSGSSSNMTALAPRAPVMAVSSLDDPARRVPLYASKTAKNYLERPPSPPILILPDDYVFQDEDEEREYKRNMQRHQELVAARTATGCVSYSSPSTAAMTSTTPGTPKRTPHIYRPMTSDSSRTTATAGRERDSAIVFQDSKGPPPPPLSPPIPPDNSSSTSTSSSNNATPSKSRWGIMSKIEKALGSSPSATMNSDSRNPRSAAKLSSEEMKTNAAHISSTSPAAEESTLMRALMRSMTDTTIEKGASKADDGDDPGKPSQLR